MAEYFLGQFKTESHEHNRPIDCVEAKNILADYVSVCRPIFVEQLGAAVGIIAESGDIVRKRVYPDIDDMLVVKVDRNAPFEGRTGNAEILNCLLYTSPSPRDTR